MQIYELKPTVGTRKSFYGKALVQLEDDGSKTLFSYMTPIARRNPGGTLSKLYEKEPSQTTWRHIKAFTGITRKEWDLLPLIKEA